MSQGKLLGANKAFVMFAALVVILAGIKMSSDIIVPMLLALFVAIICNPLIHYLAKFKVPKSLAIVVVFILISLVGMSVAGLVGQSLNDFSQSLPEYKILLQEKFIWLVDIAAKYNILIDKEQILSFFDPSKVIDVAANTLSGLGSVMANLFLIILTAIFMLFEAPVVSKKVHLALADPQMKMKHIDRFLDSVNSYLAIKTLVSLGTGVLAGIFLWILDVDYFVLWGVLAFILNYIPNIGSMIAAIPAVLLALVLQGPAIAGIVAMGYMTINTIMGNVVEPRFMGKGLGLSTLVVFLSLIFWGWLLGTVGMLLSVPLTMIVKIALEASNEGRWLAVLLGNIEDEKAS